MNISTEGWTRRVQLVRRDGRDVSTLYGREGGGAIQASARIGARLQSADAAVEQSNVAPARPQHAEHLHRETPRSARPAASRRRGARVAAGPHAVARLRHGDVGVLAPEKTVEAALAKMRSKMRSTAAVSNPGNGPAGEWGQRVRHDGAPYAPEKAPCRALSRTSQPGRSDAAPARQRPEGIGGAGREVRVQPRDHRGGRGRQEWPGCPLRARGDTR